jgi:diguanylate cyclase (GGDEF)-like protein/PAS domain S-box-containing protein
MSLRKKFFLFVTLTLTLMLLIASVTSNHTTMQAFRAVERRFFRQDMARVQNRLDSELQILRGYAADWGAWDSMYFFMEDGSSRRFDEMLDSNSLRALDVDLLALFDSAFRPVVAYIVDSGGGKKPLPERLSADLKNKAPLLMEKARQGAYDRILATGDSVFLLGVSPILMTNRTGPSRGLILVGASLEKRLPVLIESLGTDFDLFPVRSEAMPDRSSGDVLIFAGENGEAAVWQNREEDASIMINAPRTIYEKGRESIIASFFWVVMSGIGIFSVVMLLLEKLVLRRLRNLREVSDKISGEGKIELRVPVEGHDEITALSSSFNALLHSLENLVMDIPDALFITDAEGDIILVNSAAHKILGRSDGEDLKDIHISTILGEEKFDSFKKHGSSRGGKSEEGDVFEAQLLRVDGTLVPVEIHRRHITFGALPFSLLLARDLTERKKLEERLADKAYFDDLTGLPNRYSFIKALNRALKSREASEQKTSVAVINMDHFKLINAQVGNFNGDRILLTTAERVKSLLEPPEQLYRTGGDEFSLLLPAPADGNDRTQLLIDRIRKAIGESCAVGDESVFPSASIGVLLDIAEGKTSSGVIDASLHALAEARKSGIGGVGYYRTPEARERNETDANILTIQAELHAAMEKDEFLPYFQPVCSLDSGSVHGFETLARWLHPRKGLLLPAAFISQAEHTGFIPTIDTCMIENALRALVGSDSLEKPRSTFFTANGSSLFLRSLSAVETIEFLLEKTGADPTRFTMEVTESTLIENLDDVRRKLDRLKQSGIRIALDDFGTGFSSLQYINRLPFDCIKLDRTFISQIFHSAKTEYMIRTIIAMGRELGLDVIAEGVETEEQRAWLEKAGCLKAQGYYFSKPVPWNEAEKMILKGGVR